MARWLDLSRVFKDPDPFEPTPFLSLVVCAPTKLILYYTYQLITYLRSHPAPSGAPISIVCISDTHNLITGDVPAGDILVHAGDLTVDGSIAEIQKQVDWLASMPHKEVIAISGNHDTYLDPRTRPSLNEDQRTGAIDWKRVHYLQHRRVILTIPTEPQDEPSTAQTHLLARETKQRRVTLYGAPQIPACGPMDVHAFQYPRGRDAWSETIPEDVDILITHTPPKHHLDLPLPEGLGCEHLAQEVKRVKPGLHVFGHVHWGAGSETVWWDGCQDAFDKGMNIQLGWTHGLLDPWLWVRITQVAYRGFKALMWEKVWGGQQPHTIMVNAAQMHGNTGKLGNPAQIVVI